MAYGPHSGPSAGWGGRRRPLVAPAGRRRWARGHPVHRRHRHDRAGTTAATRRRATARAVTKVPVRLTSTTARQSSTVASSTGRSARCCVGHQRVRGRRGRVGRYWPRRTRVEGGIDGVLVGGVLAVRARPGRRGLRAVQAAASPSRSRTPTVSPPSTAAPAIAAPDRCHRRSPSSCSYAVHQVPGEGRADQVDLLAERRRALGPGPVEVGARPRENTRGAGADGHRARASADGSPSTTITSAAAPGRSPDRVEGPAQRGEPRCGWRTRSPRAGVTPRASTITSNSRACQCPYGVSENPLSGHRAAAPASWAVRSFSAVAAISAEEVDLGGRG